EAAAPTGGPLADFAADRFAGVAPLTVQFADLSAGDATAWSWDFGDGATSTLQNPSHIFQNSGSFTVTLTTGNSGGQSTRTKTGYIAVKGTIGK
ncbi:MAG TPA: PKD domain-containing protein, partial [Blastocatellia bacterium]|nr:PKD domain-containing protein [Blastocatellia bacterium]